MQRLMNEGEGVLAAPPHLGWAMCTCNFQFQFKHEIFYCKPDRDFEKMLSQQKIMSGVSALTIGWMEESPKAGGEKKKKKRGWEIPKWPLHTIFLNGGGGRES